MESGFVNPPDSIHTGVYWYWMSDNISKEGVIRDLQAMKKAGIMMAFIGNIGATRHPDVYYPNYPGGRSKRISERLSPPAGDFQDVKTLAFPTSRHNLFDTPKSRILYSDNLRRSKTGSYQLPPQESHIDLILPEATVARSVMIYPGDYLNARCQVQIRDGDVFRTVKTFPLDRSVRGHFRLGYDLKVSVVESLPNVETSVFRIVFTGVMGESVIIPTLAAKRYAYKCIKPSRAKYKMYKILIPQILKLCFT
jgi:hypothetical protein